MSYSNRAATAFTNDFVLPASYGGWLDLFEEHLGKP